MLYMFICVRRLGALASLSAAAVVGFLYTAVVIMVEAYKVCHRPEPVRSH